VPPISKKKSSVSSLSSSHTYSSKYSSNSSVTSSSSGSIATKVKSASKFSGPKFEDAAVQTGIQVQTSYGFFLFVGLNYQHMPLQDF